MAKQLINLGVSANDGLGDTLRIGAQKVNDNFTELYDVLSSSSGQLAIVSDITARDGISVSTNSGSVLVSGLKATSLRLGVVRVDGTSITVSDAGVISANVTVNQTLPFKLPTFTTAERDAFTAENGHVIYNSTTNRFQGYQNGEWVDLAPTVIDGGTAP